MTSNASHTNPVVSELLVLLATLRGEYQEAQQRLERELGLIREKMKSVETTLELYVATRDIKQPVAGTVTPDDIRGLSHKDALVKIAQLSGGLLKVQEAKRLLIAAKLATGAPKNVAPSLYMLLRNDERFKHVGPGTFELLALHQRDQPRLLTVAQ